MRFSNVLSLSLNNICGDGLNLLRQQAARTSNHGVTQLGSKFLIDTSAEHEYPKPPASFVWLINLAKQHSCRFIEVDPSGPTLDSVPVYEHPMSECGVQHVEVELADCNTDEECGVAAKLRISAMGISIGVAPNFMDEPIHVELYNGVLTTHIWADPEQEDPTHQIPVAYV